MTSSNHKDLKDILDKHKRWLLRESGGVQADLSSANLSSANLRYADLRYANLRYANLRSANLSYANLRYANLRSANLSSADLRYANLSYADLRSADLRYANLRYADLSSADLSSANLPVEEMIKTKEGRLILATLKICPQGPFTGFKKVINGGDCFILTLEILGDAQRMNAIGARKCRASKACVVSAETLDGEPTTVTEFTSLYDINFQYRVGEVVESEFDPRLTEECSKGIHFFLTKEEALDFAL